MSYFFQGSFLSSKNVPHDQIYIRTYVHLHVASTTVSIAYSSFSIFSLSLSSTQTILIPFQNSSISIYLTIHLSHFTFSSFRFPSSSSELDGKLVVEAKICPYSSFLRLNFFSTSSQPILLPSMLSPHVQVEMFARLLLSRSIHERNSGYAPFTKPAKSLTQTRLPSLSLYFPLASESSCSQLEWKEEVVRLLVQLVREIRESKPSRLNGG